MADADDAGRAGTPSVPRVTCRVCGAPNESGEPFCDCGAELLYESGAADPTHGEPGNGPAADLTACPACGADIAHPGNRFCVECLEELRPPGPAGSVGTVWLRFTNGPVHLPPDGGTVLLGRSSEDDGVTAVLGALDNVSRHHALVRIDTSGAMFVRDERSRNGTFVNDVRLAPGAEVPLAVGDVLRLASDVTADVERATATAPARPGTASRPAAPG